MDQYIFDNLRKILSEYINEDTIVPVNKTLIEMKLYDIDYDGTYQSEYYEPIFMIDNFIKIIEYRYHGTFEDDKRDEFWGRRD
jgi:hypothetical protein